jgi:hypothetical protein
MSNPELIAHASQLAAGAKRAQIQQLEDEIRKLPQFEVPTEHTFGPSFYVRTIRLPAGATLTGKVHATEHVFLLSQGELLVVTEDGQQHIKAPCQMVCRPGLKRAGHALTDVVCSNLHITTETDLAKLEAELISPDAELSFDAPQALEGA